MNFIIVMLLSVPVIADDKVPVEEVVVDGRTHLIWQKIHAGKKEQCEAMIYCRDLTYAGKGDWRLPNLDELISAFWVSDKFEDANKYWYWSSTLDIRANGHAWYVNFNDGEVTAKSIGREYYVRCVRGGK